MPPRNHDENESEFLYHIACDNCGSSDANSLYSDGHQFCHKCDTYVHPPKDGGEERGDEVVPRMARSAEFLEGRYDDLEPRGLQERTLRKFGYRIGARYGGQSVHVGDLYDTKGEELVAQQLRTKDKTFPIVGNIKQAGLFGQQAWRSEGKMLVITEGYIDAMSVAQVQDLKWPVVSVTNGAKAAKKSIARAIEWCLGFETIILFFDNDEEGIAAAKECALLFPAGRVKIAAMPDYKDANEALLDGAGKQIIDAIWGAKEYRPDGLLRIKDVKARALADPVIGLPWFDERLTALTYGRRTGVYCLGAGTGVGKTDFLVQQVQHDVDVLQEKVGLFFLEQPADETLLRVAGKFAGKSFHVPDGTWTKEELEIQLDRLDEDDRIVFYDNFGSTEWDVVAAAIRHLRHAEGIRLFYVDNLTALAAGSDLAEKEALEEMMAAVAMLAKELDVVIHLVSHLSTPEGKSHEEGGRVMIKHFKGSRAIGFWCNFMFGMERDQQHDDPEIATLTTFRILKDRLSGRSTGKVIHFGYAAAQSRLVPSDAPPEGQAHGFRDHTKGSTVLDDDVPF
ncbi:toprim domain-containing protein [Bosea sp. RCC_152_1]|uniref:toprim domain-containing protein n=1 Tax=Bosea sp. RCC_152_1 TaxID=3239228 RepID=UPI00352509F8